MGPPRPLAAAGGALHRISSLLAQVVSAVLGAAGGPGVQASILAANIVLFSLATRRLRRAQFAASVRAVQQLDAEGVAFLLRRHLPMWIKHADWERGEHLQSFVTLAWPTFNRMICNIIKREVEERLGSHGEFGRVSFARLSFGRTPPVVTAVKGVPLRDGDALAMVIDIDVRWAGEPDVVMQLSGIPGAAVAVRTCQVAGMLRLVLSPIEEELPFLTGLTLSLLDKPYLDFDIRVLGGDVMSLPALGSWLRSSVAGIIQERLVWPENLGWRWGPSWDRQQAEAQAAAGGGRALLAPEQQRRRQLPPPLGVLLVEVVGAELEPRRSTFLGRLKPVSSRLSLLLPAATPVAAEQGAHAVSGPAAARPVLQKGLTSVQAASCKPHWQQSFAFVVSSRHQVMHLLLSHKRSGVLAKGVVAALGADVPLGSTEVAVADILGEAAAHEEWTVQEMLLEAAKLEVAAAAGAVAGPAAESDVEGYESAEGEDDAASFLSASPGLARSGSSSSLGLAFAAAAAAAARGGAGPGAFDEDDLPAAGTPGGRWFVEAATHAQPWQRADTPPPRQLARWSDRSGSGGGGGGSNGSGLRAQWLQDEPWQARQQRPRSGGSRQRQAPQGMPLLTPPAPNRAPSWRRSATRSPSPDRQLGGGVSAALLDPSSLMQLQMEQSRPETKWLAAEGVWVDVASANVMTLAGLLSQVASEPPAAIGSAGSPRSGTGSEEEDGWLGRLQRYILGHEEGEGEGDEFAPSQAPLAGRLQLRLTWQPVEAEAPPQPLLNPGEGQHAEHAQQAGQGDLHTAAAAAQQQQAGGGGAADLLTPPPSRRQSVQLPRETAGGGGGGGGAVPPPAAGTPDAVGGGTARAGSILAALDAVLGVEEAPPRQGVLAVRVAHTKLDYATDLSYPVLAVSIDRRPPDPAAAAVVGLLGASPSKPAAAAAAAAAALVTSAAAAAAAAASSAAAAGSPQELLGSRGAPPSTSSLASLAPSEQASTAGAAAAGAAGAAAAPRQRWISMESTPGSRMGLLHWGQVFYIPTALSEADCLEGRVVVELGEVASAARFNLFGPALYSLDASESFKEDVKVAAAAAVPLKQLLHQRRLGGSWRLKEATAGVAEADRLDLGRASVQLAWFPLGQQPGACGAAAAQEQAEAARPAAARAGAAAAAQQQHRQRQ